MRCNEDSIIHPIELITREDQSLIHILGCEEFPVLVYGIGGTLWNVNQAMLPSQWHSRLCARE